MATATLGPSLLSTNPATRPTAGKCTDHRAWVGCFDRRSVASGPGGLGWYLLSRAISPARPLADRPGARHRWLDQRDS